MLVAYQAVMIMLCHDVPRQRMERVLKRLQENTMSFKNTEVDGLLDMNAGPKR